MSLLSTEHCYASLSPGHVAMLRVRSGWRPKLMEKRQVSCQPNDDLNWQAELHALEELLGDARSGLPLTVVLSNQLARYRLVPAAPPMMSPVAALSLVQHCFREVYGDAINQWEIRANPLPYGDVSVACAIDLGLIEGIRRLCDKQSLRLQSIQPYFMAGFNRIRRNIGKGPCCLVQVENGRLMIATYQDGTWQTLNTRVISSQWTEELLPCIRRELLMSGLESKQLQVFLIAPQVTSPDQVILEEDWALTPVIAKPLSGLSPLDVTPYVMALSGA